MSPRNLSAAALAVIMAASCSCSITDPLGFSYLSFRLENTDDFTIQVDEMSYWENVQP